MSTDSKKSRKWRPHRGTPASESPFAWVAENALKRISEDADASKVPGLRSVYLALCQLELAANSEHKGSFAASQVRIGKLAGLTARRVRPYLDWLHEANLIESRKPTGEQRLKHEASLWRLVSTKRKPRPAKKDTSERDKTSCPELQVSDENPSQISNNSKGFDKNPLRVVADAPDLACAGRGVAQLNGARITWEVEKL